MAKKNKKANRAKTLPRVGTTFAVAMAMTVALSNQAQAAEVVDPIIDEIPLEQAAAGGQESSTITVNPEDVPEVNAEISQSNGEVAEQNAATAEQNKATEAENAEAAEGNEAATGGELAAPDLPTLPDAPTAPEIPNTDGLNNADQNDVVDDYNGKVDDYNGQVDDYNAAAGEYNTQVDGYNSSADAYDKQAAEDYQKGEDAYKDYQDQQQAYEDAQKAYEDECARLEAEHKEAEDKAEAEHNAAQDQAAADHAAAKAEAEAAHKAAEAQAAADQLAKEKAEYEAAKAAAEAAHNTAEEQAAAEQLAKEKAEYEAAKAAAEAAHKAAEEQAKTEHNAAQAAAQKKHEEEEAAAKAAHEAAEAQAKAKYEAEQKAIYDTAYEEAKTKYYADIAAIEAAAKADHAAAEAEALAKFNAAKAEALAKYEAALAAYNGQIQTEENIYDTVTEYNEVVQEGNQKVADQNAALAEDLDANAVESLEGVGEANDSLEVADSVLTTLGTYKDLTAEHQELLDRGAALDTDPRKDDELGSETYAAYLADVQQYNSDVDAFNDKVLDYNKAVETYNDAVAAYNEANTGTPDASTGSGTVQGENVDIDWGNIKFTTYGNLTHVDVKYNAAASKDVTTVEGKPVYSDTVTQYTVTGVYASKEIAESDSPEYGLVYSNDGWKTSDSQALKKDEVYDEFGNPRDDHLGESLNPVTGEVSFYVTLEDTNNVKHGITVNINANSVYAKGSYLKVDNGDFLDEYRDSDGNAIFGEAFGQPVEIDGYKYYDISGKSVFLVSALTCDGVQPTNWFRPDGNYAAHGLDLILNMQTMIEIHKADNANTINYLSYEYGKTAQATKEEHEPFGGFQYDEFQFDDYVPGTYDPFTYPDFDPDPYVGTEFTYPDFVPTEYEEKKFTYPTFVPTTYEKKEFTYPTFVPTEYEGTEFTYPEFVRVEYVRNEFVAPEYDGPAKPEEVAPPVTPPTTERLDHVDTLDYLEPLLYATWTPPAEPAPETEVEAKKPAVETVAMAKPPKTGDLSAVWGLVSGMSLAGIGMLNKKREEE